MKTIKVYILINILFFSNNTFCQVAWLDTSFNHSGHASFPIISTQDQCNAIVIQPDNKIVLAGSAFNDQFTLMAVIRCNTNGSIDQTFGINGKTTASIDHYIDGFNAVTLQHDGKIVAVGEHIDSITHISSFLTVRFNTNGTLDSSFSADGMDTIAFSNVTDRANAVEVLNDGKIIVAGESNGGCGIGFSIAMVRYNSDGSIDNTFGNFGKVVLQINSGSWAKGLLLIDNNIYITGSVNTTTQTAFLLAKFLSNGQLDYSYGTNGIVISPFQNTNGRGYSIGSQSNGKIICGGFKGNLFPDSLRYYTLIRYNSNGSIDSTFGTNGIVFSSIESDYAVTFPMAIQSDDKIIIGISNGLNSITDIAVERYLPDGNIDNSFGVNGKVITDLGTSRDLCNAIAVQSDGKIVVAGEAGTTGPSGNFNGAHFFAMRYLTSLSLGVIDLKSENKLLNFYPNPVKNEAIIDYELTTDQIIDISIFDLSGRQIKYLNKNTARKKGLNKEFLNLSDLINGTYIVSISNKIETTSIKIIKE